MVHLWLLMNNNAHQLHWKQVVCLLSSRQTSLSKYYSAHHFPESTSLNNLQVSLILVLIYQCQRKNLQHGKKLQLRSSSLKITTSLNFISKKLWAVATKTITWKTIFHKVWAHLTSGWKEMMATSTIWDTAFATTTSNSSMSEYLIQELTIPARNSRWTVNTSMKKEVICSAHLMTHTSRSQQRTWFQVAASQSTLKNTEWLVVTLHANSKWMNYSVSQLLTTKCTVWRTLTPRKLC